MRRVFTGKVHVGTSIPQTYYLRHHGSVINMSDIFDEFTGEVVKVTIEDIEESLQHERELCLAAV